MLLSETNYSYCNKKLFVCNIFFNLNRSFEIKNTRQENTCFQGKNELDDVFNFIFLFHQGTRSYIFTFDITLQYVLYWLRIKYFSRSARNTTYIYILFTVK